MGGWVCPPVKDGRWERGSFDILQIPVRFGQYTAVWDKSSVEGGWRVAGWEARMMVG